MAADPTASRTRTSTVDASGSARAILQFWGDSDRQAVVPVPPLALPDQPFSPSGQLLAGYQGGRSTVVDVSAGGVLGSVAGQVSGWYDEDHLVVLTGRSVRVVDYRSGTVLVQRDLAAPGRQLTGVWLAPLHGRPPAGAAVL